VRIYTLWEKDDDGDMPWLVAAVDEYCIEENGFPPEYVKRRDAGAKEIVLTVPDRAIVELVTQPPMLAATVIMGGEK